LQNYENLVDIPTKLQHDTTSYSKNKMKSLGFEYLKKICLGQTFG